MRRFAIRPLATAIAAWLIAASALAAEQDGVPEPKTGRWAETVLSLLHYNRDLCDSIAGKVVAHWRNLGATPEAELKAVRQFVVDRELSNLASGRTASDIVESFLPRLREEASSEVVGALERLHRMEIELCDTVAYPDAGREAFELQLKKILDRIEREEAELGQRLVVPRAVLDHAIGPYLGHIQMAGVEAEGEYRDYLDSLKPPPVLPTLQELMEAWHRRYAPAVMPTKQALAKYLRGRRDNDALAIRNACREISAAVIPLLQNDGVFQAPEKRVYEPLQRAFLELRMMAGECNAGRSRETETHYRSMQEHLASVSAVLAEFSLRP